MKAFIYLQGRIVLNWIKNAVRKPVALIAYLIVFAGIIWLLLFSSQQSDIGEVRNLDAYSAFVLAMFGMIFVLSVVQGLKRGTALFKMADVNLVFTSPLSPRRILVFGILRQAGVLLLASLFMLAQYPNMKFNFGLGAEALVGIILGYFLVGIFSNLFSANLYALCAANPRWRERINLCIRIFLVLLVVGLVFFVLQTGDFLGALRGFFGNPYWRYVPVLGWSMAIAYYAAMSSWLMVALYSALLLLSCGAMLLWLAKSNADYYEDVLTATENAHATKEAAKEGKIYAPMEVSKRVKREASPLRGNGATAFFFRTLREQRRTTLWLFSLSTLAPIAAALFGMFFGDDPAVNGFDVWTILYFGAYTLAFLSATSSVGKELTHHYVFVAPAHPIAKLIAISTPQLIRYAADSVVFLVLMLILIRMPIGLALASTFTYFSLGYVFMGEMLLAERLLRDMKSRMLTIVFYFLILLILVVPGFVLGGISGVVSQVFGLVLCALWNILMGTVLVACGQGLLKGN